MSENRGGTGDTLLALMLGAAAGAAAALLLAPSTGREARKRVRRWLSSIEEDLREEGADLWEKGKDALAGKAGAVKDKVETVVREALDRGERRERER